MFELLTGNKRLQLHELTVLFLEYTLLMEIPDNFLDILV